MERAAWCSPNTPLIPERKGIIAAIVLTVCLCIRLDKKDIGLFYLDKAWAKNVGRQRWKLLLKKRAIGEKYNSALSLKTFLNCFTISWCRRFAPAASHIAQGWMYPGAFSGPELSPPLLGVPHPRQAGEELSLSSLPLLQARLFCLFSRLPGFLC